MIGYRLFNIEPIGYMHRCFSIDLSVEKSAKKKERMSWGNVRSVNVCYGAPAGVNGERKSTHQL